MVNAEMTRKSLALLTALLLLGTQFRFAAAQPTSDLSAVIDGIIAWQKAENGAPNAALLSGKLLAQAGSSAGDWIPLGLGRLGMEADYPAYRAVLRANVETRYARAEKLDKQKATEWHRIALAVLATGGDPTNFGKTSDGKSINLIADGVYRRDIQSLGAQGLNGLIWGLIALDALRYELPPDAALQREDILTELLRAQTQDGGFSMEGSAADPDITAMVLTALAPYYNSEKQYSYQNKYREQVTQTVRAAVDAALICLSAMQTDTGGFVAWGTANAESCAQAIIALCALGIDPANDARFLKNGSTLLDGLLRCRQADGGFAHTAQGASGTMASEQALYALAALCRFNGGFRSLFDFRPEMPDEGNSGGSGAITDVRGNGKVLQLRVIINEADLAQYRSLPQNVTMQHNAAVLRLCEKIRTAENGADYGDMLADLLQKQQKIQEIQAEIESINAEILEKLYPFDGIRAADKERVASLLVRAAALSEEDRALISGHEDLLRAQTRLDTMARSIWIFGGTFTLCALLALLFLLRIRKKRAQKRSEQLQYEEDED